MYFYAYAGNPLTSLSHYWQVGALFKAKYPKLCPPTYALYTQQYFHTLQYN